MKKFFLFTIVTILFATLVPVFMGMQKGYAQSAGINNDGLAPHTSAMLDVRNPNKGFLAPRVTLTGTGDVATIPSPAISLLVFNTATAGTSPNDVTPGYYYWSGTAWLKLSTGSSGAGASNAWLLTGNAGTVDGTNFIGTTDDVPFNIRVNNQKAGRIDNILFNTFWGYQAGNNTTGSRNTANGFQALFSNILGIFNTANGFQALYSNTFGSNNTANGAQALYSNTGSNNTANGYQALRLNTGNNNTANGANALSSNTIGSDNTANGYQALRLNTGNNNTANGSFALSENTTGEWNTANGSGALYFNTTGYSNVAVGVHALVNNTTASNLVAIGDSALYNNTGTRNTAVGSKALYSNTTGTVNTANGSRALFSNTGGDLNTANGGEALFANIGGAENTANGYRALFSNTTGNFNTANGRNALFANIGGGANTANGYKALSSNTTGTFNTALGTEADVSVGNLTNATAIGNGAKVNANNTVQIGNGAVTDVYFGSVGGGAILHAAAYNMPSDARFKYNIQNNVPGLEFIKKLKPVTYYFDEKKLNEYTKTGIINSSTTAQNSIMRPASYSGEKQTDSHRLHTGFLAQDVEKLAKELGYSFDGVHAPQNDKDHYSLAYSQFIMPLVKSVQELNTKVEALEKENEMLKSKRQVDPDLSGEIPTIFGKQQVIIENQNKKINSQQEQIKKMNEKIEALAKTVEALTHK